MPRILVVDDMSIVCKALKFLLEKSGYTADTAAGGNEALEKSRATRYDLSLIDLKLPDVDGIRVCSEIKKISPETACVLMTGCVDSELKNKEKEFILAGGSRQTLYKPFSEREVLAVVQAGLLAR